MSAIRLFKIVLDTIFPRSTHERHIETLTPEELGRHVRVCMLPDETLVCFPYTDPLIKQLIWDLKYRRSLERKHIAKLFAHVLADYIREELIDHQAFESVSPPLLIPIPLSAARQKERGFNHMDSVAECLQKECGDLLEYKPEGLRKVRDTSPQARLKRAERLVNLTNAFEGDSVTDKNRRVILIDDVTTTGSTLREARRALMRAGATSVSCIALAC